MNAESTLQMLEAQGRAFVEALPGIKSDPNDMARLHAARLARKRMAMALKWMGEMADGLEVKKNLHRTRELFSAMGEVRDLQLMQARLAAHSIANKASYEGFSAYLKKHLATAQEDLLAEIDLFHEEQMEKTFSACRKALKKSSLVDFDAAAGTYARKLFKAVSRVSDRLDEEKALHKLRGQIRECTFFLQMLQQTDSSLPLTAAEIEAVKGMGARLGEWHDRLAFQETLTKWVKKHTSRKEDDPETALYQTLRDIAKQDVKDALAPLSPAPSPAKGKAKVKASKDGKAKKPAAKSKAKAPGKSPAKPTKSPKPPVKKAVAKKAAGKMVKKAVAKPGARKPALVAKPKAAAPKKGK